MRILLEVSALFVSLLEGSSDELFILLSSIANKEPVSVLSVAIDIGSAGASWFFSGRVALSTVCSHMQSLTPTGASNWELEMEAPAPCGNRASMGMNAAGIELSTVVTEPGRRRRYPSFVSNLATVLSGQAASALLALATEVCYARLLGPAGRGQLSLGMMVIAAGVLLGGLGGDVPTVIWTADSKMRPSEWFPAVLFWGLSGSLVVCALWTLGFWTWHPIFLQGVSTAVAAIVLVAIPVQILFGYLMAIFTGRENFAMGAGLTLVNQIAKLAGVVLLIWILGQSAEAALSGYLFGLLVVVALAAALLRGSLGPRWDIKATRRNFGRALSLGVRGQFGNLATFLNYRLDVFVVNYFLGPAQVGLYAIGVLVSESLWQIPHAAATALFPRTVRTVDEGATEFTCLIVRHVLLVACVSGVALALVAPFLIPIIFGARYSASIAVVWWILPGTIALAVGKVVSADLAARCRPGFSSIFACVSLIVTAFLDFILIPRMGINGAALASSAAYLMDAVLLTVALKFVSQVRWKALLVPTRADLALYRQVWRRYRTLAFGSFISPTARVGGA